MGVFGASCAYGVYRGALEDTPSADSIDISPTGFATDVYYDDGSLITQLISSGSNRVYVTLDEIPDDVEHAFVAIEDERFYEHNGIDKKGITRAFIKGITNGFHFSEGASTITQQLLKNNVFTTWTDEKGFGQRLKRKIQEQYLAIELEKITDKDTILENYLNTINLGAGCLGVQAAAKRYFDKDAADLTLSETAVIAGITQNPTKYNPINNPRDNAERREKVLSKMLEQGYITDREYTTALEDDVYAGIQTVATDTTVSAYSYFVDALIDSLKEDLMDQKGYSESQANKLIYTGGLSVYTTQDKNIQKICDKETKRKENYSEGTKYSFSLNLAIQHTDGTIDYYDDQSLLSWLGKGSYMIYDSKAAARQVIDEYEDYLMGPGDTIPDNGESVTYTLQPQTSMVIMDQHTGEVKAIVGGRGKKNASLTLNRATDTYRQPGSTFKVLSTYAPALDTGKFTLASVQDDAHYEYENGTEVHNYDGSYRGWTTLREAIKNSINIVTVKTLTDLTPKVGYEYLENFGFTSLTDTDMVQALALGGITKGVSNIELTAAFAAIANGGEYIKPRFYTKVYDHDGNILIDNTAQTHQVISNDAAWLLTSAMEDVVKEGTGTAVNFGTTAIAGKTGTTTNNVDSWFAGYTDYYTCAIWGGYDTNASMGTTSFTKIIWKAVMEKIHKDLEYAEFTKPSGVTKKEVCSESGLLPKSGTCGGTTIEEYFAKDTVPKDECDHHVVIKVCSSTGKRATSSCPSTTYRTFISEGSGKNIPGYCTGHDESSDDEDDDDDKKDDKDKDGDGKKKKDDEKGKTGEAASESREDEGQVE